jgi:hypothetical protein
MVVPFFNEFGIVTTEPLFSCTSVGADPRRPDKEHIYQTGRDEGMENCANVVMLRSRRDAVLANGAAGTRPQPAGRIGFIRA